MQLVPVASVLAEPVPINDGTQVQLAIQPGQAEDHIDTISMPSFPATIIQEADSSFIVPVELQAGIECVFMLHLSTSSTNVMHVVYRSATAAEKGLLAHESQQTLETDIVETCN